MSGRDRARHVKAGHRLLPCLPPCSLVHHPLRPHAWQHMAPGRTAGVWRRIPNARHGARGQGCASCVRDTRAPWTRPAQASSEPDAAQAGRGGAARRTGRLRRADGRQARLRSRRHGNGRSRPPTT
ncbi:hypothetical protein YW3DRAFT_07377 [Streptomyces sp. MnatMP-M77]|nr:hypothetical protein YW3DRAFT_07377 [Streptomyces sp. MnatMP-M77]